MNCPICKTKIMMRRIRPDDYVPYRMGSCKVCDINIDISADDKILWWGSDMGSLYLYSHAYYDECVIWDSHKQLYYSKYVEPNKEILDLFTKYKLLK